MRVRDRDRGEEANDVPIDPAGKQDEAAFLGLRPDSAREVCVGGVGAGVGEFDGDHEAGAADVGNLWRGGADGFQLLFQA